MSEPVLRALLIKPGGIVRVATVTKTEGVVYLNYASQKLMRSGTLVSMPAGSTRVSQPRKLTDAEKKMIATALVDNKPVKPTSCFEMVESEKTFIVIPM